MDQDESDRPMAASSKFEDAFVDDSTVEHMDDALPDSDVEAIIAICRSSSVQTILGVVAWLCNDLTLERLRGSLSETRTRLVRHLFGQRLEDTVLKAHESKQCRIIQRLIMRLYITRYYLPLIYRRGPSAFCSGHSHNYQRASEF